MLRSILRSSRLCGSIVHKLENNVKLTLVRIKVPFCCQTQFLFSDNVSVSDKTLRHYQQFTTTANYSCTNLKPNRNTLELIENSQFRPSPHACKHVNRIQFSSIYTSSGVHSKEQNNHKPSQSSEEKDEPKGKAVGVSL